MTAARSSTRLLRNGASLAALIASAWGLPSTAQAQSCTLGSSLDGLPTGTVVTCPAGTQLVFPGGNPVGPIAIPNSSTITGLAVGTGPTHQGWSYTDPSGNSFTVFIQGIYNLQNGIGGTTVLQGPAIQTLSGAGACGTGGLLCPTNGTSDYVSQVNVSPGGGGGIFGEFSPPPAADIYVGDGQALFIDLPADATAASICDGLPAGVGCGGGAPATESGTGLQNSPFFDLNNLPAGIYDEFETCQTTSGGGCAIVVDGPEVYVAGPFGKLDQGFFGQETDFVFDQQTVLIQPLGSAPDSGALLFGLEPSVFDQHDQNLQALQATNNASTSSGDGVLGGFSRVSPADTGFLFTTPHEQSGGLFVVSAPVQPVGNTTYFDFGKGAGVYVDTDSLPGVVSVSPGRNASGVDPKTSFVVTFTEPMDTSTIEENFSAQSLPAYTFDSDAADAMTAGDEAAPAAGGTTVWDKEAFDISWNSDDTEATFTFQGESPPPGNVVPDVVIGGEGGDDPRATQLDFDTLDEERVGRAIDTEIVGGEGFATATALLNLFDVPLDTSTAGVPMPNGDIGSFFNPPK